MTNKKPVRPAGSVGVRGWSKVGAVALLAMVSSVAVAGFSGTATLTSDYDYRGISQTDTHPALQGSVDFAADTGFYAGIWASNVDFGAGDPNAEVDFYTGWGGGEDITWDLGITYYTYINEGSINYPEAHLGVGWKYFDAKAWYAWDYSGLEGNVTYPLPANFGLTGHAGYTNGNGFHEAYGQASYMDWSVGVTYTWSHFDMALKWVDGSDLKTVDNGTCDDYGNHCTDVFSSEARAIFQISTTFPWKKEGEE